MRMHKLVTKCCRAE